TTGADFPWSVTWISAAVKSLTGFPWASMAVRFSVTSLGGASCARQAQAASAKLAANFIEGIMCIFSRFAPCRDPPPQPVRDHSQRQGKQAEAGEFPPRSQEDVDPPRERNHAGQGIQPRAERPFDIPAV